MNNLSSLFFLFFFLLKRQKILTWSNLSQVNRIIKWAEKITGNKIMLYSLELNRGDFHSMFTVGYPYNASSPNNPLTRCNKKHNHFNLVPMIGNILHLKFVRFVWDVFEKARPWCYLDKLLSCLWKTHWLENIYVTSRR